MATKKKSGSSATKTSDTEKRSSSEAVTAPTAPKMPVKAATAAPSKSAREMELEVILKQVARTVTQKDMSLEASITYLKNWVN